VIAWLVTLPLLVCGDGDLDARATQAYRERDYATAAALWQDALAEEAPAPERARLLYNLGNSAFRRGRTLEAVGWYTAALRLTPRDPDLWSNLELARSEADLEPADRGDLAAFTRRVVSSLTYHEAQWLLLIALAVWGACLAGEALRGGVLWRRLAWLSLLGVAVAGTPLAWHSLGADERPLLVVQSGGTQGRSEPRADAKALTRIEAGAEVLWRDELPGWVGIETDGRDLWVRKGAVFELDR
jgi:tetratricopeptide (TPR) repeat protein